MPIYSGEREEGREKKRVSYERKKMLFSRPANYGLPEEERIGRSMVIKKKKRRAAPYNEVIEGKKEEES